MSGTSSVYHPMLDNLTARLAKIVKQIRGEARLTEANIQDALREVGEANVGLNLATQPPAVILMAGLQGSGKTTTCGKLAKLLVAEKKKVLLVSCDVYRPAAIEQLNTVANQAGVDFLASHSNETPSEIAKRALEH